MSIEDDIDHLGNIESFVRLLTHIHAKREDAISGLYLSDGDELMRTSGEIRALDELLSMCKYNEISDKWKNLV